MNGKERKQIAKTQYMKSTKPKQAQNDQFIVYVSQFHIYF